MRKISTFIFSTVTFLLLSASPALAENYYTFTASNVLYNQDTHELSFTSSNLSHSFSSTFRLVGITNRQNGTASSFTVSNYNALNTYQNFNNCSMLGNCDVILDNNLPTGQGWITPVERDNIIITIQDQNLDWWVSQDNAVNWFSAATPTPTPSVKIISSPASNNITVGTPFNVDVKIEESNADAFNAARANVSASSNLSITGINNPNSNACNFQYTQTPTTSNPSFAGAIFGGSSTGCTVYTMTLTPTSTGAGTITFTNGSIKSYSNNSEILTGVQNGSFTIADGPTPTPTPALDFTIANVLPTYHTTYTLTGTKLESLTHIFVNGSDANSTYPTIANPKQAGQK